MQAVTARTTAAPAPRRRPTLAGAAAVVAGVALAGAACGSTPTRSRSGHTSTPAAVPGVTSASAPPPPPSTTSVPVPTAGQPCTGGQLALTVQGPTGAAGAILYTLVMRNTAATTCTLTGYPQVSLAGSSGTAVGQPLGPQPGTTPATVTLTSGGQAAAEVALHDPSVFGCPTGTATGVEVAPPGGTGPAVRAALPRSTAVCTGAAPGAVGSNATTTPGTVGPVQPAS